MRESGLEKKLKAAVEKSGGRAYKFVSPGAAGVPDRLILINGQAVFAEVKAQGEKLRPLQEKRKRELEGQGFRVYVIDREEAISDFLEAEGFGI